MSTNKVEFLLWNGKPVTLRRKAVGYSLVVLLVLFCSAVGFGLGSNNIGVGGIIAATLLAIIALEASYIATVLLEALHR